MNHSALLNAVPPLRATLPPSLAAALASSAEIIDLKPGQELLQIKLTPPRVAFLSSGFAAYAIAEPSAISDVISASAWIALPFTLNPDSPAPSVWAVSHASVTTLQRDALMKAAYASPPLALALALAAADDARIARLHLAALRTKSANGRCAYLLCDLAARVYCSSSFECSLDQSSLAALAGLSRGAFNRALKALSDMHLLSCDRSRYRLLDIDGLNAID